MARAKKTRKSRIKRCVKRVLRTMVALILLLCVVMVAYIVLLEYGIVKLDSKNQVKTEKTAKSNVVDTKSQYHEIERQVETKLEEETQSKKDAKNQMAGQSNKNTAKESDEVSEKEDTTDTSPKVIEVGTIGNVKQENVEAVENALKLMPQELIDSYVKMSGKYMLLKKICRSYMA